MTRPTTCPPRRECDTCCHRDGADACGGCYHAPEEGFESRTGRPDYPHWAPRAHPDPLPPVDTSTIREYEEDPWDDGGGCRDYAGRPLTCDCCDDTNCPEHHDHRAPEWGTPGGEG